MRLDEAFERVLVINLPFKKDRKTRLKSHFEKNGIVDLKKVVWTRAICGDWTPPPAWWGAGNGAWGCLMSHLRIGQDAIHDKLASYCVLEDDVVFHERAPEMLEYFMKELPNDWGQTYLGGQFLHREPESISPWVMRPYNVNRTHAFAVSSSVIPRFLQHIMHAPDYFNVRDKLKGESTFDHNCFHIDHQLGRAHERRSWNTYAPTWWLAGQDEGNSNISGRTNPQMWWHWRDRGHKLPFFFIEANSTSQCIDSARQYLHVGYNTMAGTLTDIGLKDKLDDNALMNWLRMIAGEAIERWKLPGFEVPVDYPDLPAQVQKLWSPGLLKLDDNLAQAVGNYPFNGYCGGLPQFQ